VAHAKYGGLVSDLREIWAADLGYLAVNRMLAARNDHDLTFIYLRGPDMISHKFYHYMVPERSTLYVQPDEAEIFRDVVKRYYDWCDEALGEILGWFPPDRQVVVVSDHGFYGPRRGGGKGTIEHSEWGVFLVRSPLYEAGAEFDSLELLDICPTILALIGLPPGADMPGAVLDAALTPAGERAVRRLEGHRFPTYMPLTPQAGPEGEHDAAIDEELRQQLRSLGYIN
jgi:predicted AlkP superfamily phosphohydrolase/phosphomutase